MISIHVRPHEGVHVIFRNLGRPCFVNRTIFISDDDRLEQVFSPLVSNADDAHLRNPWHLHQYLFDTCGADGSAVYFQDFLYPACDMQCAVTVEESDIAAVDPAICGKDFLSCFRVSPVALHDGWCLPVEITLFGACDNATFVVYDPALNVREDFSNRGSLAGW